MALAGAARVMACLHDRTYEGEVVPVWISGCEDAPDDRPLVLDLGEGCGTVAAHLLLDAALESSPITEILEIGVVGLLDRIRERGLGANVNYPPLYALGTFFRLIGRLTSLFTPDGAEPRRDASSVARGSSEPRAPKSIPHSTLRCSSLRACRRVGRG